MQLMVPDDRTAQLSVTEAVVLWPGHANRFMASMTQQSRPLSADPGGSGRRSPLASALAGGSTVSDSGFASTGQHRAYHEASAPYPE